MSGCQHKVGGKTHYERNKSYYVAAAKTQQAKVKAFIRESKNKPCVDCSKSYPYYVMDFDHRPGELKLFDLKSAHTKGLRQVKAEIEKCDVVCANCHRIRTHERNQYVPSAERSLAF